MDDQTHDFGATVTAYATGASAGADLYAGEGALSEADALEARAREIRAREAEAAAVQAAEEGLRFREAFQARRVAMADSGQFLGFAMRNVIEAAALLTWSPSRIVEADHLISVTARNLADARSRLMTAAQIGATLNPDQDQGRDPHAEVGNLYETALTRMREVHRQTGAFISLFEMDMTNTPALVAMARSIDEEVALTNVAHRNLSLVLDELGMTR